MHSTLVQNVNTQLACRLLKFKHVRFTALKFSLFFTGRKLRLGRHYHNIDLFANAVEPCYQLCGIANSVTTRSSATAEIELGAVITPLKVIQGH